MEVENFIQIKINFIITNINKKFINNTIITFILLLIFNNIIKNI